MEKMFTIFSLKIPNLSILVMYSNLKYLQLIEENFCLKTAKNNHKSAGSGIRTHAAPKGHKLFGALSVSPGLLPTWLGDPGTEQLIISRFYYSFFTQLKPLQKRFRVRTALMFFCY
jgi:hypothetical protein